MSLRQQARAGTVYAPGLNYAPIPSFMAAAPVLEDQRIKTINGVQVSSTDEQFTVHMSPATCLRATHFVWLPPDAPLASSPQQFRSLPPEAFESLGLTLYADWPVSKMYALMQTPVQPEVERVGETITAAAGALSTSSVMGSTDEEDMTQEAKQCVQALREGKR